MGYFSQRKKHHRINLLLHVSFLLLFAATIISCYDDNDQPLIYAITSYRFHYYVLSFIFAIFALINRYLFQGIGFVLLFIFNYFLISATANIFDSVPIEEGSKRSIIYQNYIKDSSAVVETAIKKEANVVSINNFKEELSKEKAFPYYAFQASPDAKSMILSDIKPSRYGRLVLNRRFEASFVTIKTQDNSFIIINLNLRGISVKEQATIFENLSEFILNQDEAIIIVGDFGIPVWSSTFKNFLLKTELEVKNNIILTNGLSRFNPLNIPSINLLSYKNVGVTNIEVLPKTQNSSYPIYFELMVK